MNIRFLLFGEILGLDVDQFDIFWRSVIFSETDLMCSLLGKSSTSKLFNNFWRDESISDYLLLLCQEVIYHDFQRFGIVEITCDIGRSLTTAGLE